MYESMCLCILIDSLMIIKMEIMEGFRCHKLVSAIFRVVCLLLILHINPSLSLESNNSGVVHHMPNSCVERERQPLIEFKQGLVDNYNRLSSWGGEAQNQDCCKWEGVYCDNRTGHVIQLHLGGGILQDDEFSIRPLQGKISPKLIELQHLTYMDLSNNDFNGSQIPKFIGSLSNLRFLNFYNANFGGPIPYQLGNLTHLQHLDLNFNVFTHVQNLNWLPHLSSLTYLDLSLVQLSNVLDWLEIVNTLPNLPSLALMSSGLPPPVLSSVNSNINSSKSLAIVNLSDNQDVTSSVFKWLCNYNTSLVRLDLSFTHLSGPLPDSLGHMSSLIRLDLYDNQIEGGIPHSFGKLCSLNTLLLEDNNLTAPLSEILHILSTSCVQNSLQRLDLSGNHISGPVPNLSNFSSLQQLVLHSNRLTGKLPESIGQMSNLTAISFGMNSMEGIISETHFSKLSKLKTLVLSSLVLDLPDDWVPPFQLNIIDLGSCKIGPYFPKWLRTQKDLIYLDISNAGISDIIPSWLWDLCYKVYFMDLSHNQIRGTFGNSKPQFAPEFRLNLSLNQLEGPIPSSILSAASSIDLSNNNFSGPTSFLCASTVNSLTFLDLSRNHVSGELPDCWTYLEKLVFLDLSHNAISGKIPPTMGYLLSIETLKLDGNKFVGELPSTLMKCKNLRLFDVGENELSGSIPEWLGVSLSYMVILIFRSNHFYGSMPPQLCHLADIQILDLSMNNISGTIPKCLNNLTALAMKENQNLTITHHYRSELGKGYFVENYDDEAFLFWKGIMSGYKSTLGLVKSIDLSSNRLSGEIPSEIAHLLGLVSLNMSRNHLTSQIPPEIGKLQSLDFLDLSRNQIDGRIPTSLARIDRLSFLDLSYNNLSGKIPIGTQLQSFDPTVYTGNPQLCGFPLQKMCAEEKIGLQGPIYSGEDDHHEDEVIRHGFYISMGLGFVVGFWGVCGSLIFNRSWRYAYYRFLNLFHDWLYVRVALIWRQLKDMLTRS